MHINQSNGYIIELSLSYNPEDFYYLFEKYDDKFQMYISSDNEPLGLEWYATLDLLNEPVIKNIADTFKDFLVDNKNKRNERAPGVHLVRTNFSGKPNGVEPHVDWARNAGLVIPITFPQNVQWFIRPDSNQKFKYDMVLDHNYNGITFINVGGALHGVKHSTDPRWQIQFDVNIEWETIPGLLERISDHAIQVC